MVIGEKKKKANEKIFEEIPKAKKCFDLPILILHIIFLSPLCL